MLGRDQARAAERPADGALTDEEAMIRIAAGDSGYLGLLFERHHRSLFNFFLRMSGDPALSEDLVQELFLRLWRYRRSFRPEGRLAAWMYRIAHNLCIDQLRKTRGERPLTERLASQHAEEPAAADDLERQDSVRLLKRALLGLPDEKRAVIVLSRFHELRGEEIGRLLGCTPGAVKLRLHRALKELRTSYHRLAAEVSP